MEKEYKKKRNKGFYLICLFLLELSQKKEIKFITYRNGTNKAI